MSVRKSVLWKVPVYCIVASFVSFYLRTYLTGWFAFVRLPDGSLTNDPMRTLVVYGVVFVVGVLFGWPFLRSMTKKEIFLSASIVALCQLVIEAVFLALTKGPAATGGHPWYLWYLPVAFEWSSFFSQLAYKITESNSWWVGILIKILEPYIFVVYGKDSVDQD